MSVRMLARVAVLVVLVVASSALAVDSTTLLPDDATTAGFTDATVAATTYAEEETATDSAPMMVRVDIPETDDAVVSGNGIEQPARGKEARKLDAVDGVGIGLPLAMMSLPSPATLRGPVVVVAPNATAATLPPPSPLPLLDGDEDFMTDMQEIETDMEMAERSASVGPPQPAAVEMVEEEDSEDQGDIPANHKKSSRVSGSSDQNSLLGKQSRFATVAPQDKEDKKYEMMMAKLPIKDFSMTGRDKPLDVVFVFPHANETRKRELEVVLVFPQGQNATSTTEAPSTTTSELTTTSTEAPSTTPSSTPSSTTTTATPTTTITTTTTTTTTTTSPKTDVEEDDRQGMASERKETTADAPVPSPTRATAAINRPKSRQDIYKKYANKYASSRPPPVSFFRKDDSKSTSSVEEVELDTGASEVQPSVLPPPAAVAPWPMSGTASRVGVPSSVRLVRFAGHDPAPAPLYIPTRMHATRPPPNFPSLPPATARPMLIVVPPMVAVREEAVDAVAAPTDALPSAPVPTAHRGSVRHHSSLLPAQVAAAAAEAPPTQFLARPYVQHRFRRPTTTTTQTPAEAAVTEASPAAEVTQGHARPDVHRRRRPATTTSTTQPPVEAESATTEASAPVQADIPVAPVTPAAVAEAVQPGVEPKRTPLRQRVTRVRPTTASDADDAATTPRPALPPRIRIRGQNRTLQATHAVGATAASAAGPRHIAALRNRLPGIRRHPVATSPAPSAADASATTTTTTPAAPTTTPAQEALTGDELATIHNITALQEQRPHGAAEGRMRQERLSTLQSMLVSNLMSIQKELAERHAAMRRQFESSLHLPVEHRGNAARALHRVSTNAPPAPEASVVSTTTAAPRRYRRPPAYPYRKPQAPEEDKEQSAKPSYRTLYKKRNNPVIKMPAILSTTTTTTTTTPAPTTTTTTTTPRLSDMTATTTLMEETTIVDAVTESATDRAATTLDEEPAESTDATVIASSPTTILPPVASSSAPEPDLDHSAAAVSPAPAAVSDVPDQEAVEKAAAGTAPRTSPTTASKPTPVFKTDASARPSALVAAASETVEVTHLGDLAPGFLASQKDPVYRPSRLALLGGVLPEDDPGLASGLFPLGRRQRGTFRAPQQLESGFLPVVPSSAYLAAAAASPPQIVGPIPRGYQEVLRGTPVQLDLPRADRPADFLAQTVQAQMLAVAQRQQRQQG